MSPLDRQIAEAQTALVETIKRVVRDDSLSDDKKGGAIMWNLGYLEGLDAAKKGGKA